MSFSTKPFNKNPASFLANFAGILKIWCNEFASTYTTRNMEYCC
jgi:hypothetical protein